MSTCAEAIDPFQNARAARFLVSLLADNDDEVAFAAASSLRSFKDLPSLLEQADLARVQNLMANASNLEKMVLQDFLRLFAPVSMPASPKSPAS